MSKPRIGEFQTSLAQLREEVQEFSRAFNENYEEMLKIIHHPGWTTPSEEEFVEGVIRSMSTNLRSLGVLNKTLISGSRLVGKAVEVLPAR